MEINNDFQTYPCHNPLNISSFGFDVRLRGGFGVVTASDYAA